MHQSFRLLFFCLLLLIAASACQKVIDVELNTSPSQLVIEGSITTRTAMPTVTITRSVPYTQPNAYPTVNGAKVVLTDNSGRSWLATETSPGKYSLPSMRGVPGATYTLRVTVASVTYTASSTMPQPVKLDSLRLKTFTFGGNESSQVEVHYHDPVDRVNQYQFIVRVNKVQVKSVFAENDRFTNGKDVTSILFYQTDVEEEKIRSGDTVDVEMLCIDEKLFDYWFTLMQQADNGPGGGVTPSNPPSNFDNGALGYFSAHTTETKAIVIK